MKSIISIKKETIDKITDILHKNKIEFFLTCQYTFIDPNNLLNNEKNIFLVYYLQFPDFRLKKSILMQISNILKS